jgi:hypothetical protein
MNLNYTNKNTKSNQEYQQLAVLETDIKKYSKIKLQRTRSDNIDFSKLGDIRQGKITIDLFRILV